MGERGPVPKRSSQRRRQNKTDTPAEQVAVEAGVRGPKLVNAGSRSPQARRFWQALRESGQAQFFEPSDWAAAELVAIAIDAFVERPSAMMLASISSAMSNLLVTEGDRRRVRLELERAPLEEEAADVSDLDEHRRRLKSG